MIEIAGARYSGSGTLVRQAVGPAAFTGGTLSQAEGGAALTGEFWLLGV